MTDQFSDIVNQVIREVAMANYAKIAEQLAQIGRRWSAAVRLKLGDPFAKYLSLTFDRFGYVKSLLHPDSPRPLYDAYVPLVIRSAEKVIDDPGATVFVDKRSRLLLLGPAGCGKSTLVKHLFVDSVMMGMKIPVMLPLRSLNDSKISLLEAVRTVLTNGGMPISFDVLHKALEAGMFLLLLDGFDELRHDHRGSLIADVTEATGRYRENDFIITSRPGENFNHLTEFHEYSVEPLSLPSAAELVRRSGYADAVVRSTFCSLLEEQLFNSHESFASNPLLLSIMLMTFRSFAQIPTKLSLFYGKAFSVLWDKHDAGKAGDGQIRERRSGLDEDDFVRVLEDISILTQIKSLFEFDDTILKQLILISQQMRLLEFPSTGYIHDLEEGVSLIVKDGLEYRFAHRSLQEYFAARFVVSTDASRRTRLIGPLIARVREDNVLPLVNELAPEKFERDILAPTLAALRSQLGIKSGMSITYEEYICGAIESVKLRRSEIEFRENETVIGAMNLIQKVYSILEENDLGDSELYDPQRIFARWIQEVELRNPKDVLESQPEYCVRLSKTEIIDRIAELERIVFPSHPHLSRKFFERLREIVAHIEHRMEKQGTTIEAALFDGEMQITSTSRKTSN